MDERRVHGEDWAEEVRGGCYASVLSNVSFWEKDIEFSINKFHVFSLQTET